MSSEPASSPRSDEGFMDLAIEEARATIGRTSPNPPVGAVIVRGSEVLARGRTEPPGGPHAEIVAMQRAGDASRGATLYVTLEPCCHQGRTGPCCEAVIAAGFSRVVVGCRDENPLVSGRGIEALRAAGIEVVVGVRQDVCERIAGPFFTWVSKGRPYVVLKAAVTLDGRIATRSGDSRWVTGEQARARVHQWRDRFDAILVGAGTVRADDPLLTARPPGGGGRDPVRVILDGSLETSPAAKVYRQASAAPTWLVVTEIADAPRIARFTSPELCSSESSEGAPTKVEALVLPGSDGLVSLPDLLRELARREIVSLFVEGGASIHGAFLSSGLVDEIRLFVAPKLVGAGPSWLSLRPEDAPSLMAGALKVGVPTVERIGEDLLLVAQVQAGDGEKERIP